MSETKFIPGPWKYEEQDYPESGGYEEPRVFSVQNPDEPHLVCTIALSSATSYSIDYIGALIAAAPDLYAALDNLCRGGSDGRANDWDMAEKALAKARGEDPKL